MGHAVLRRAAAAALPALSVKLAESGWAGNDAKRGFKVIQIYRGDCAVESAKLDASVDYVMHAETARWREMGRGEYGPMRAMMFSRLEFEGPMLEAMRNMGPFESFLLLVGKVPGSTAACPRPVGAQEIAW